MSGLGARVLRRLTQAHSHTHTSRAHPANITDRPTDLLQLEAAENAPHAANDDDRRDEKDDRANDRDPDVFPRFVLQQHDPDPAKSE